MGRKSRNEIEFVDKKLEKIIHSLCSNVRKYQRIKKITQEKLSQEANISISTIAEIEQKRISNITIATIVSLAKPLNIDALSLLK